MIIFVLLVLVIILLSQKKKQMNVMPLTFITTNYTNYPNTLTFGQRLSMHSNPISAAPFYPLHYDVPYCGLPIL